MGGKLTLKLGVVQAKLGADFGAKRTASFTPEGWVKTDVVTGSASARIDVPGTTLGIGPSYSGSCSMGGCEVASAGGATLSGRSASGDQVEGSGEVSSFGDVGLEGSVENARLGVTLHLGETVTAVVGAVNSAMNALTNLFKSDKHPEDRPGGPIQP